MSTFEQKLEKYAELGVKIGVNIQPGQTLVVNAPISTVDFVRLVAKKAYEAGAKNVHVEWNDEELTKIKFEKAPDEAFKEYPMWRAKGFEEMAEEGAAFLTIMSSNPDLLKGIDPLRIATANKTGSKALEKYKHYIMSDKVSWSILAVPSKEWAKKVFPNVDESEQVNMLWDAIFSATRINQEDPISAWEKHDENLQNRLKLLNERGYKKLYYKGPGTDLTIELPDDHIWLGGGGKNDKGTYFFANIPTEEVFTLPLKTGVNGVVASTMPLNYAGTLIENFSLTFKEGRIVDFSADEGYETLKHLIETDEGSHYLGEVALVPHNSPISNLNIIFFNTLFDENASCHLAIGNAYLPCFKDGSDLSKDELAEKGVNSSLTHVDFMVGSNKLNINGEKADGTIEAIFVDGNWAF